MKFKLICLFLFFSVLLLNLQAQRHAILFDSDWKFHRGGAQGAEMPGFDDASWRNLDLPHDWSIEDLPEVGRRGLRCEAPRKGGVEVVVEVDEPGHDQPAAGVDTAKKQAEKGRPEKIREALA